MRLRLGLSRSHNIDIRDHCKFGYVSRLKHKMHMVVRSVSCAVKTCLTRAEGEKLLVRKGDRSKDKAIINQCVLPL